MRILNERNAWLAIALGSAGLAAASLILTPLLDLHPCPLCIFQRLLFMVIAVLALCAAAGVLVWPTGGLVMALALLGIGVSTYQSWLQSQPAADMFSCGSADPSVIERFVYWLGEQLPSLFMATGFCADKELVIFGLSLANWALLSFAGMLLVGGWALRRRVVRLRRSRW
ncbi:disulfide bond formation protein B [Pseudothauera lacus]|uniref:Disulfide bond formation protein B n=1 Tax=Pseudothauera lacus TaxID=2136175 RepID=A0A2T4IFH1_9RHOO|nr:disulfide bond formation protein B [Pseudothauera lacus]PTD96523.1 disulfide bond formation protein B [Pseudothauera lacus]